MSSNKNQTDTQTKRKGSSFLSLLIAVIVVIACVWLIRTYVAEPYEIPSGSMEDTIEIQDRVFSEKISLHTHGISPGEIVTFEDPETPGRTLIKRCIAVGGQTVDLRDGHVYVDGVELDEPYTEGKPSYPLQTAPGVQVQYPYTVPDGYMWMMGDNRTNSADSRYFGAVPVSSATGHAFLRYWPLNRIGTL